MSIYISETIWTNGTKLRDNMSDYFTQQMQT